MFSSSQKFTSSVNISQSLENAFHFYYGEICVVFCWSDAQGKAKMLNVLYDCFAVAKKIVGLVNSRSTELYHSHFTEEYLCQ